MVAGKTDVRFTPETGHNSCGSRRPDMTRMYGPAAVRKRYALDSGSRSYVSGLFGRLVGRGLDGAYARALVSLIRRLEASHLCHQTLGAFISPFHSILGRELL
jgi:hypothetical protein